MQIVVAGEVERAVIESTDSLKPLLEDLWKDYKKAHNKYVAKMVVRDNDEKAKKAKEVKVKAEGGGEGGEAGAEGDSERKGEGEGEGAGEGEGEGAGEGEGEGEGDAEADQKALEDAIQADPMSVVEAVSGKFES